MEKQILEKATEMFMSQGFKTVTMDDIANDLSISKKTIYQHYASKPELIEKSLASINSILLKKFEESVSKNQDALSEMFSAYEDLNKVFGQEPVQNCSETKSFSPKEIRENNREKLKKRN